MSEQQTELEEKRDDLNNHFISFESAFKDECEMNGTFSSFQEYIDNCKDFTKPYKILLKQSDFNTNPLTKKILGKDLGGTLRIVNSGWFELSEDIVFNFNPENNYIPTIEQETSDVNIDGYNQKFLYPVMGNKGAYDLGFFAGITFECDNIMFDLNGFSLKMANEFYLLQRFFSIIELSSAPFIMGQGPGNFGELTGSNNVIIKNGTFDLSSHHSIHGNLISKINIKNIKCCNFEIAGIALNDGDNILFDNCEIGGNFKNVPVLGSASPLFFLQRKLNRISKEYPIFRKLNKRTNSFIDIIKNQYQRYGKIFIPHVRNMKGIADGLVYGIIVNKLGVAVDGFSSCNSTTTENFSNLVFIKDCTIKDLSCNPQEVLSVSLDNKPFLMGFGALLRLKDISIMKSGKPKKTLFNSIFFRLANILNKNPDFSSFFSPISFNQSKEILNWYNSNNSIFKIMKENNYSIHVNSDTMNHVHKGTIALRLDSVINCLVHNLKINHIENHGNYGTSMLEDYDSTTKGANKNATLPNYGGNTCRGVSLSSVKNTVFYKTQIYKVFSKTGPSYGVDLIGCDADENNIFFREVDINEIITLGNKCIPGNRWPESRHYSQKPI